MNIKVLFGLKNLNMLYLINILTKTRRGDAYDMVAINKYPIIYKTDRTPDEWVEDQCIHDQLRSLIKNQTTWNNAVMYIRGVDSDMTWKDWEIPVKKES